jgi:TPR repeat protein
MVLESIVRWMLLLLLLPTEFVVAFSQTTLNRAPQNKNLSTCVHKPASLAESITSAEKGNLQSQYLLSQMLRHGDVTPERVPLEFRDWLEVLKRTAERGLPIAEYSLGWEYASGKLLPKDPGSAMHWFKKAAEDGDTAAQGELAMVYANGLNGVKENHREALRWFMAAAKQGDAESQRALGQMYEDGDVVKQDYVKAAQWYRLAANHYFGQGSGRNELGLLYLDGLGVNKDYVSAYMWFALGQSQKNMQYVSEKMTADQITEGQRRAKQWLEDNEPPACP